MSLVSANKVETNTYELVVSVGAEDFKKGIDKIYKKTAKNITVPGFRKGKAPKSVIEKLYGEAVFYEDTVNDMYPDAYTKAVEEAINVRELIKINVLKNCMDDPREIAEILAERTKSEVVQVVGKKITLYKFVKENKKHILN